MENNKQWYLSAYFLTPLIVFMGAIVYFLIFSNDFDLLGSSYALEIRVSNQNEYISNLFLMITLAILVNPIMGIIQCSGEELAGSGYLLYIGNNMLLEYACLYFEENMQMWMDAEDSLEMW